MTDASIVAEPAYDQVLALSLERCLVDGMAPPLVVCLVGITGAAHVLRYRVDRRRHFTTLWDASFPKGRAMSQSTQQAIPEDLDAVKAFNSRAWSK